MTREQDETKADELEAWLDEVLASYNVLPMDALSFREWARLMHRRTHTLSEDAMIAATATTKTASQLLLVTCATLLC